MFSRLKGFFLENTSTKQTIIKNTFWLLFAEAINKWWAFFVTIFIAQTLWREQFGILSYMMSFIGMGMILADFWLTTVMVREVSRDSTRLNSYLISISFLKILLGILVFLFVWMLSSYITVPQISIFLILIYCAYLIINNFSEFLRAFFRPSEDMQFEAYLKIVNGIIFFGMTMGVVLYYPTIENIIYAYFLSWIIGLIFSITFVLKKFNIRKFLLNKNIIISSLRQGLYIGLGAFCIALYMNSDQIIMGFYSQFEVLWVYALAYKITLMIAMLSGIIFTTLLPRVSHLTYIENGISNYKKWLKVIFQYNFLLILALEFVLLALYSLNLGQYQEIVPILQWLLLYNFIEPLGYWWYLHLVSFWKENINLYIVMVIWVLNVAWNFILIPVYSYYGAIFTTIASYILYFIIVNSVVLWKFLAKK